MYDGRANLMMGCGLAYAHAEDKSSRHVVFSHALAGLHAPWGVLRFAFHPGRCQKHATRLHESLGLAAQLKTAPARREIKLTLELF